MPTNYPGGLDSWNNPSATTGQGETGYEHHLAHSNLNDAVEAIEKFSRRPWAGGTTAYFIPNLSNEWDNLAISSSVPNSTNKVVGLCIHVPYPATLDEIAFYVNTPAETSSGSVVKFAIYDSDGSHGAASTRLAYTSDVSIETSGQKLVSLQSTVNVNAGWVWLEMFSSITGATNPTFAACTGAAAKLDTETFGSDGFTGNNWGPNFLTGSLTYPTTPPDPAPTLTTIQRSVVGGQFFFGIGASALL
jgi:hypothetical protein